MLILFHKYKVSQFRNFQRPHSCNNGATDGSGKDEKVVPSIRLYSRNYELFVHAAKLTSNLSGKD